MECSSAQGYFSSKYSSYWIEVESPLTIQVYLSSNSIISPLIATVAEETEILQRWQTDDGGQKGEGQEKLPRTEHASKACVYWERELSSPGWWETNKQDRGKTDWRAESRKKRCDEPCYRENSWPTPGEVVGIYPEQEAFSLWLGEKVTFWTRNIMGKEMLKSSNRTQQRLGRGFSLGRKQSQILKQTRLVKSWLVRGSGTGQGRKVKQ